VSSAADGQASLPEPESLDHDDRVGKVPFGDSLESDLKAVNGFLLAPVAAAEKDQARTIGLGHGQQARVIEIGGDDDAPFASRPFEDDFVGRPVEADPQGVHGIVAALGEPCGESR